LQVVGGEPGQVEDVVHAARVEVLAGVAGGGQREQLAVQRQPGAQHRGRLQRLVRRPREDGRVGAARGERERAVGGERRHRAAVPGLHETGPDDLGEHRVHGNVGRGQLFEGHRTIMVRIAR
jgi:hypothetical protein